MTGAPLRRAGEELEGRDGDRALEGLCRRGPAQPGLQRCTADRERSKVCAGNSPSVGRGLLEAEGVRFASKLGFSLVANRNPLLAYKVLATSGEQALPQKEDRRNSFPSLNLKLTFRETFVRLSVGVSAERCVGDRVVMTDKPRA